MLYQPKLLTLTGVIAPVSASRSGRSVKDNLAHVGGVSAALLGGVCIVGGFLVMLMGVNSVCCLGKFAMQLSAPYIIMHDFYEKK